MMMAQVLRTEHARRRWFTLLLFGVALCSVLSLSWVLVSSKLDAIVLSSKHNTRDVDPSAKKSSSAQKGDQKRASMDSREAEKKAVSNIKQLLRMRPKLEKARDTFLSARSRVSALRASAAEIASQQKHVLKRENLDKSEISTAVKDRQKMALSVAAAEATLKKARQLAAMSRKMEEASRVARSESEREEAEGAATQGPAEGLLRDSRRLNDQSNLVLDQSHSPQAKALAALDLKMAQSLAQRAADGMARAKAHFAHAIDARKRAVADDAAAASDITRAAQESLHLLPSDENLKRVASDTVQGGEAMREVVSEDLAELNRREEELGASADAVEAKRQALAGAAERVSALALWAESLRKELAAAQLAARRAAEAQSAASQAARNALSGGLAMQLVADDARTKEAKEARAKLAVLAAQKRKALREYNAAMRKVADLSGKQTLLQVEVARLTLELKEAQMQRDDSQTKEANQQQTINSLQVQLDKEDEQLSRARLALADQRLHLSSAAAPDATVASHDDDAASASDDDSVTAGEGGSSLEEGDEEQREDRLRAQEAKAEAAARAEETKLRRAQASVRAQMAKVAALEHSFR